MCPRAEVVVCVKEQPFLMNVAIVKGLPADIILGRDLPILCDILQATMNSETVGSNTTTVYKSCAVLTRAQAKAGLQPLADLHSSLLQGGTKDPKKKHVANVAKYMGTPVTETSVEGLTADNWRIPDSIGKLQKQDESLKSLFEKIFE